MAKSPYGLAYGISEIGAAVPQGYMRGLQMRQQAEMQRAQLEEAKRLQEERRMEAERQREEYLAYQNAVNESKDASGNVDFDKLASSSMAFPGIAKEILPGISQYQRGRAQADVAGQKAQQNALRARQAFLAQNAFALKNTPPEEREQYFDENVAPELEDQGMSPEAIARERAKIQDDNYLGNIFNASIDPNKRFVASQQAERQKAKLDQEWNKAVLAAKTKQNIAFSGQASKERVAAGKLSTTGSLGRRIFDILVEDGASPTETFEYVQSVLAKNSDLTPAERAMKNVSELEKAYVNFNGKPMSQEKKDELIGKALQDYQQYTPPKAKPKAPATASQKPATIENPNAKKPR